MEPRKEKNSKPRSLLPRGSVRGELGHAEAIELLKSLGVAGKAAVKHPSAPKKRPPLTEVEVIETYRQIPEDAVEPALAKLNCKEVRATKIPALARFRKRHLRQDAPRLVSRS